MAAYKPLAVLVFFNFGAVMPVPTRTMFKVFNLILVHLSAAVAAVICCLGAFTFLAFIRKPTIRAVRFLRMVAFPVRMNYRLIYIVFISIFQKQLILIFYLLRKSINIFSHIRIYLMSSVLVHLFIVLSEYTC